MGGDFNCIADPELDRSHPPLRDSPVYKIASTFRDWQTQWGTIDIWRRTHPLDKEYSHLSHVHDLHVRVDTFQCSPDIHAMLQGAEYLTRTISDHNPLLAKIQWGTQQQPIPTWRLKPEALEDQVFLQEVRGHITTYFADNAFSTDSRGTEWEAFKSVIRGRCMASSIGV